MSNGDTSSATAVQETHPESRTRRSTEKRRRRELEDSREARRQQEARVLGIAASGASLTEIARQMGLSVSYISKVYRRAMDRVEGEHVVEFRQGQLHRLGMMLQQAWAELYGRDTTPSQKNALRRDILAITDQMNRLQGAYPAVQVDVTGDLTIRREMSVDEVLDALADIQADLILSGKAEMPGGLDLGDGVTYDPPALATGNGHVDVTQEG